MASHDDRVQVPIRMPHGLKRRLADAAENADLSVNQIMCRLAGGYVDGTIALIQRAEGEVDL